jgi:hypothetical protein
MGRRKRALSRLRSAGEIFASMPVMRRRIGRIPLGPVSPRASLRSPAIPGSRAARTVSSAIGPIFWIRRGSAPTFPCVSTRRIARSHDPPAAGSSCVSFTLTSPSSPITCRAFKAPVTRSPATASACAAKSRIKSTCPTFACPCATRPGTVHPTSIVKRLPARATRRCASLDCRDIAARRTTTA